jgi:uncharacterized RDD family membrane protein YckC
MTTGEIHFETPENIRISYRAAGPGTRFVAWVVDNILLWILTLIVAIPVLLVFGAAIEVFARDWLRKGNVAEDHPALFLFGLFWVLFSLSGFLYFGLCELLFRGQTIGKRQMGIRVVKSDGFALDPVSILVRTLFRVVDHLPPLWAVPLFSQRSQRLGDLVAGTVVVADEPAAFTGVHELANRKYADCRFHFDVTTLSRARRQDLEAVERVLERWETLSPADRESLLDRLVAPLAARLQVDSPQAADRRQFLEDLLSAEYRRQFRKLG